MSLAAFGRRQGVSHEAVRRAVANGRLSASLWRDANGKAKIADLDLADREWQTNVDRSKAPGYVKEGTGDPSRGGHLNGAPSALALASTREKQARASLAELELAQRAGELVRAADVERVWSDTFATLTTMVLATPSRMKARCPDLTHTHLAVFYEELATVLESFATMKGKP